MQRILALRHAKAGRRRACGLGLALVIALLASSAAGQRTSRATVQPNIILIVLDDVGTDKLSFYGESESATYAQPPYCGVMADPLPYPRTPTLEALAQGGFGGLLGGGIRFDQAYAAPICCVSRGCLMTGRYGFRNGLGVVDDGVGYRKRLSNSEVLVAELLRKGFGPPTPGGPKRYRSGAFGKWHMSALPVCDPVIASDFSHAVLNGFHAFEGTLGNPGTGSSNPGDHYNWTKVSASPGGVELTRYEVGAEQAIEPFQFSSQCTTPGTLLRTTAFSEESFNASVTRRDAVQWINAQTQPFFAYVSFHPPHFPYQVPPLSLLSAETRAALQDPQNCAGPYCAGQLASTVSPCGTSTCGNLATCAETQTRLFYNAMLEAVDTEIANLLAQIDPAKLTNSVVFVLGDNGTPPAAIEGALHDTSHGKGSFYELSVRVPMIAAGRIVPKGAHQSAALVHAVDFWRTLAEISGANESLAAPLPLDSISFRNQLVDPSAPSARTEIFSQGFGFPGPYRPTDNGPYDPACKDPTVPGVFNWAPRNLGSHGRTLSDGRYKLVVVQTVQAQDTLPQGLPDSPPQYHEELYDLLLDPAETNDLAPQIGGNPGLAAIRDQLRARITAISGF